MNFLIIETIHVDTTRRVIGRPKNDLIDKRPGSYFSLIDVSPEELILIRLAIPSSDYSVHNT